MSQVQDAEPSYKFQTLQDLSPGLVQGITALSRLHHEPPQAIEATRPASTFLDQALFDKEVKRLFRRLPVPITLSAMLPNVGSIFPHKGYGVPLIVMRGKDGVARTFLNACKHRGAQVVEQCEPFKANRVTCPYHAWTFALDGQLVAVPREETFKNLQKSERALTQLPCKEAGGFIWAILDPDAEPDFSMVDDGLVDDLNSLRFPQAHVYGRKTFDLKANWKLVLEPFFEPYHVQRLHAKSLTGLFADVPGTNSSLGIHNRQISGKANFTPESLAQGAQNIHKTVTLGYQIFPSMVLVTSPYYISVLIIMPKSINESYVDYYMITQSPPDSPKAQEVYERSYQMILNVFGNEDFHAAESAQIGIASGALKTLVYCGLEENIPAYYKKLDAQLGM